MPVIINGKSATPAKKVFEGIVEPNVYTNKKDGSPSIAIRGADGKKYRVASFTADGKLKLHGANAKSGWPVDSSGKIQIAA